DTRIRLIIGTMRIISCSGAGLSRAITGRIMKLAPGLLLAVSILAAQNANNTPDAHIAAAKAAAGEDFQNLFNFQCYGPGPGGQQATAGVVAGRGPGGGRVGGRQPGPPDRSTWYAEPVKVFDNLYFF